MSYPDEKEWQGFMPTEDDINGAREAEKFLHDLPMLATNFIVVEARKHGLNMTGDDMETFCSHISDATMDSFTEGFERINNLLHRR